MTDIADDLNCSNVGCEHPGSMHTDLPGGKNSGACTSPGCVCKEFGASVTGEPPKTAPKAPPAPAPAPAATPADPAPAKAPKKAMPPGMKSANRARNRFATFATVTSAGAAAQKVDAALDAAQASLDGYAGDPLPASVRQMNALIDAADAAVDSLLDALGVADPDEGGAGSGESDMDPADLAAATDAAIDAALAAVEDTDQTTWPQEVADAYASLQSAEIASDDLMTAMGLEDPADDDAPEDDPAAKNDTPAPTPMPPGMSAKRLLLASDLPAAPAEVEGGETAQPFNMPIVVLEGVDTGDGRYIKPGALTWRDLPLVVMALTKTTMGHDEAELVARIDTIERYDASALVDAKTGEPYGNTPADGPVQAIRCSGVFTSLDEATKVIELVREKFLRGVSADIGDVKAEIEFLDENGNVKPPSEEGEDEDGDILDILFGEPGDVRECIIEGRIMGATICPFPAFEGAYIEIPTAGEILSTPQKSDPADATKAPARAAITSHDRFGVRECKQCENGEAIVASAGPISPPRSWFESPKLTEATPLTIEADGRIYGHLAVWGSCHTGSAFGACIKPPKSRSDYAYFRTGAIETFEGDLIPIGQITMGTGHADLKLGVTATLAHYDNTGTAIADIAAGEDRVGIWVTGAMRPDVTPAQVRALRASALSGDWRRVGVGMEMLAALAVNVPGFPVPRAMVASGAMSALTAAGGRQVIEQATSSSDKLRELLAWKTSVEPLLLDAQATQFRGRVHR